MSSEGHDARRVLARLEGRVQGVGFRWFTRSVARELGVTGWVRNLAGGEVEAEACGDAAAVAAFLQRIARGPAGARVERMDVTDLPDDRRAAGEEIFEIRS